MTKAEQGIEGGQGAVMPRRRGKWSAQQRRQIVGESRAKGAAVQEVARRHGVRPSLLSAWRRQDAASRAGKSVKFAAVKVGAVPAVDGLIEIDLRAGCVRVRGIVDGAMLGEVLALTR